jgi:GT2 family glycosyltransferase
MLEEIKSEGEYFDEAFFAYREDADLSWRAQWAGWRCLYVAGAHGFHVRRVLPERRAALPPDINMHSFKNRFLLRIKNMDAGTYARFLIPITVRDLAALGYILLREHSSLRAFPLLCRAFPRTWSQRRALHRQRRVTPRELRSWFSNHPVSKPVQH